MIKIYLRKLTLFSTLFFMATVMSCDGDTPEEEPTLDTNEYRAQVTAVDDVANKGNASDIQVKFNAGLASASVQEYRLIIVKSTSASSVDLELAKALAASRYTSVTGNGTAYDEKLTATQEDFEGGAIEEGTAYKVLVLSVGSFDGETVYVLSEASEEVEVLTKAETSTLVSNMPANDALSVDAEGNIYVSNYGVWDGEKGNGTTALKITPSGQVSVFATGLTNPVGNAIDAEGNFYVNDENNFSSGNLLKITPDGTKTTIATIQGYPAGLLLGTDGNFYVSNYNRGVVSKVTPDGTITEFATDDRLAGAVGIAYGDGGNIIVGNLITGDVLSINTSGAVSLIGKVPTVVQGSVIGYITFFEGNVYATAGGARKIYKISLAGEITEFAGSGVDSSVNGELKNASFSGPNGIVVDKNRRVLYVSEAVNGGGANLRVIPLD